MKMDIQNNALNLDTAYSIKYKHIQNYQMDIYIPIKKYVSAQWKFLVFFFFFFLIKSLLFQKKDILH